MPKSLLEELRLKYSPPLPVILSDILKISFDSLDSLPTPSNIAAIFPHVTQDKILRSYLGKEATGSPLRIGVVFSGGQAAGGHNVIAGLFDALVKLHPQSALLGFLDGPGGIVEGKYKELKKEEVDSYRNLGGFDLLGSGRTKIETDEQLKASLDAMQKLKLDGLIVIGGDDSNTNSALLAEYFLKNKCETKVIGVPKTIDGDLTNSCVAISFGFDTATKTYAELIGNLAKDTISDKKYYHFIKLMGRSASHIALECALTTHPNLVFIGEEKKSLQAIINEIVDLIITRAKLGKRFGIIVIPEGLIEFIPEISLLIEEISKKGVEALSNPSQGVWGSLPETIQKQFLLGRDAHGNLNVSAIATDTLLIEMVLKELKKRNFQESFFPVSHFFGYEGRSALPSNFDATYATALGYAAALLVDKGYTGYMCYASSLTDAPSKWMIGGIPITSLMHFEMRKGKNKPVIAKTLVDLKGKPYLTYLGQKEAWKTDDSYLFPGPIQFFGDKELTDTTPRIIDGKRSL